jgi:aspartate carbamoyltransferase catalytic subunit
MKLKHLYTASQLTPKLLSELFLKADDLRQNPQTPLKGKIMASLFYEPSTRTRLSFEAAMIRLGGSVIGTENAKEFSSASKGESLEDSIRVISSYVDTIVIRHHENGAGEVAASVSSVPVISGGDGSGQHPTQSLLDLYTIHRELGHIDNLTISMVGDLKYGRTVRSLSTLLSLYKNITINFVSPKHLTIGDDIKILLKKRKVKFTETSDLNQCLATSDIVYMTRIQKERMSKDEYTQALCLYKIDEKNLKLMPTKSRLMHPLPHVEEISLDLKTENTDLRVAYFRQAENGLYARMALLVHLLT